MTQLQIQYFLTIAREKSISRAAELLYISQPAVSKQLTLLEKELGVPLFVRHAHDLEITDAGMMFEKLFVEFQTRFNEILSRVNGEKRLKKIDYYLSCMDGWDISTFCPELFSYMNLNCPEADIHVTGLDIDRIIHSLNRGESDGVIVTANLFSNIPKIHVDPIAEVDAVVLFSARHPMASKAELRFFDLKDAVFFITASKNMKMAQEDLIYICKKNGFVPKIEYISTLSAAYMKMHTGHGAIFTNEWIMAKNNPAFRIITLDYKRTIGIASLEGRMSYEKQYVHNAILNFFKENAVI